MVTIEHEGSFRRPDPCAPGSRDRRYFSEDGALLVSGSGVLLGRSSACLRRCCEEQEGEITISLGEGHLIDNEPLALSHEGQPANLSTTHKMAVSKSAESKLFKPMTIGNGKTTLDHRVILAPLTRNRGTPLTESTAEKPNRVWLPNDLMVEYYSQRTTKGGLLITEGVPPSLEVCCFPTYVHITR